MADDWEIAQSIEPRPILAVAAEAGLAAGDIEPYGAYKAKLTPPAVASILQGERGSRGKLVLVTAVTPTRAGEGKTTVAIGLAQALVKQGVRAIPVLREPSLGPVFGKKGGGTGGGYAQIVPMDEINLHFTGDLHAISSANNLLAAMADNHIHHGLSPALAPLTLAFNRVVDMNDRGLRRIVSGLGGRENGMPAEQAFSITAASEVMAILCLAQSLAELKDRCGRIVLAQDLEGNPVTAADIGAQGSMAVLMKAAVQPNLVQTLEGTLALVHGGPFANIAHGCPSVLSLRAALRLGEVAVSEAGFGSDLGYEKFIDILAANFEGDLVPDACVLVVTVRALKLHGGVRFEHLGSPAPAALEQGLANLDRHAAIIERSRVPFVVAVNRFLYDKDSEVAAVLQHCQKNGWAAAVSDSWQKGGEGGLALAKAVREALQKPSSCQPFYSQDMTLTAKLESLTRDVYGGRAVELSAEAEKKLDWLDKHGFSRLAVCVAKTQYSLSSDPAHLGAPEGFVLPVRDFKLSAGAGFVVALAGEISTMPGLPRHPAAIGLDIDDRGRIFRR